MSIASLLLSGFLTFVELNCENLFDCRHDSLKNDTEFLPTSARLWTPRRYWRKLDNIGRTIIACSPDTVSYQLPDLVALVEVENDSVLNDLTHRSLLRNAGYEYIMTCSPDERGLDVALLYQPFSFQLLNHHDLRVSPMKGQRPTRDILYASGRIITGDTLHIFVVHAPSRYGGERETRPYRRNVAERLIGAVDSLRQIIDNPRVIVAGDFNDYLSDASLQYIETAGLHNVTAQATGRNGARGTYRYQGLWRSLDHIFVSKPVQALLDMSYVNDQPFLLEEDPKYGGVKPRRTYNGFRYQRGFSDHLPLVVRFRLKPLAEE